MPRSGCGTFAPEACRCASRCDTADAWSSTLCASRSICHRHQRHEPPRAKPRPTSPARRSALRERIAAQPGNGQNWAQLAGVLVQGGRQAEAAEAFDRAIAGGVSPAAVALPHALALSAAGRQAEAVAVLQPVQARKPKDFALTNALGVMLKRAGRLEEAVTVLEAARRIEPRNVSPWQNLGNVHELRGDFTAAAAAFAGGLKLDPRNAELWRLHGRVLRALDRHEEALASFERAYNLDPKDRDAAATLSSSASTVATGRGRRRWRRSCAPRARATRWRM
jgi:tetratricopeptide (TPR) repeat protein